MPEEVLLTLAEAAQLLRISLATIKRHIYAGRIRATKIGGLWRIRRSEIDRLLDSSPPPCDSAPTPRPRRRPTRGK